MKGLRFVRRLGSGVNGIVWLVKKNGIKYALKKIEVFEISAFENEVNCQMVASSMGIAPRICEYSISSGRCGKFICFILMEYLEGFVPLSKLLHKLEIENRMGSPIYNKLQSIYENASDLLRMNNIYVSDLQCMVHPLQNSWKIIDFGMGRFVGSDM